MDRKFVNKDSFVAEGPTVAGKFRYSIHRIGELTGNTLQDNTSI